MQKFLDGYKSLAQAFFEIAERLPDREVYRQPQIDPADDCEEIERVWHGRIYTEVRKRVAAVARYLIDTGVAPKDRVAILSNTRPEWMEADIANLAIGGVSVSIYQSLTAFDVGYILFDSQAQVVFAENQEQVEKLLLLSGKSFPIPGTEERPAGDVTVTLKKIITFERAKDHPLVTYFGDIVEDTGTDETEIQKRLEGLQRSDLAALVYTSGTTGAPKGVIQTHGNHLSNVRQAYQAQMYHDDTTLFLLLPLAHSFAKLMGYIGFLTPAILYFPGIVDTRSSKANPVSVMKDMREANAKLIPVVPRLLEKMQAAIVNKAKSHSIGGGILRFALAAGATLTECELKKETPPVLSQLLFALTGFVRSKIKRRLFGTKFVSAVSGGAKLPVEVGKFFRSIGCEVLEGYGLTETCVATNVNRPGKAKIGTVGPVLAPDVEAKIDPDGEILFRGPNVSIGYWGRPAATKQSWDSEGWFHTGDLGSIDADGFLAIEGRKKELIVTSGGKKIAPDPIEQKLKGCGYISQAVLMGEGKKYCVALVTLDPDAVRNWAAKSGVKLGTPLNEDKHVVDLVNREVAKVNAGLASFETVKHVAVLAEEMTVENGLLTPTFKVKRKEVSKRYGDLVEGLYALGAAQQPH